MLTNIRMYDCAFGDCFRISYQDEQKNIGQSITSQLYVDFGIHRRCPNVNGWKQNQYNNIINDIPKNSDFLLTHYHYDHYSGLLHMIQYSNQRFNNVYIPDIWGINGSINVVQLFLLKDLFTRTVLYKGMSLLRFLISICYSSGRIYFIKRGNRIQDRYVALWPLEKMIEQESRDLLEYIYREQNINEELFSISEELRSISEELCNIMREISQTMNQESRMAFVRQLEALEQRCIYIAQDIRPYSRQNIRRFGALQKRLADFKHKINIIFHNISDNDRNILFTGDAENNDRLWNFIETNFDGAVPFHKCYNVIKIPHHGTERHYHDFTNISNNDTSYLISNGLISQWTITQKYSNDANNCRCILYCSNKDSCQAAHSVCNCYRNNIIYPNFFIDI